MTKAQCQADMLTEVPVVQVQKATAVLVYGGVSEMMVVVKLTGGAVSIMEVVDGAEVRDFDYAHDFAEVEQKVFVMMMERRQRRLELSWSSRMV